MIMEVHFLQITWNIFLMGFYFYSCPLLYFNSKVWSSKATNYLQFLINAFHNNRLPKVMVRWIIMITQTTHIKHITIKLMIISSKGKKYAFTTSELNWPNVYFGLTFQIKICLRFRIQKTISLTSLPKVQKCKNFRLWIYIFLINDYTFYCLLICYW